VIKTPRTPQCEQQTVVSMSGWLLGQWNGLSCWPPWVVVVVYVMFVEEFKKFFVGENTDEMLEKFITIEGEVKAVVTAPIVIQPQIQPDYGGAGPYGY